MRVSRQSLIFFCAAAATLLYVVIVQGASTAGETKTARVEGEAGAVTVAAAAEAAEEAVTARELEDRCAQAEAAVAGATAKLEALKAAHIKQEEEWAADDAADAEASQKRLRRARADHEHRHVSRADELSHPTLWPFKVELGVGRAGIHLQRGPGHVDFAGLHLEKDRQRRATSRI